MSLTHSHTPRKFSFHSDTLPSPQLTAKIFPAKLQDTRQTTSGNLPLEVEAAVEGDVEAEAGSRVVFTHGAVRLSFVQIMTVLSLKWYKRKSWAVGHNNAPVMQWQYNSLGDRYLVPMQRPSPNPCDLLEYPLRPSSASLLCIPKFSLDYHSQRSRSV